MSFHPFRSFLGNAAGAGLLAALLAPPAAAQTLYAIEGTGPTFGRFVGQGTCGTPTGPFLDVFPATQLFPPCPPLTPFVPPAGGMNGDIGINHVFDRIWATDGLHFARYTPGGLIDLQFILPIGFAMTGPATGLGTNSSAGTLWVTDGDQAANIAPGPSCTSPTILSSVPLAGVDGMAQDIDYDSCTGTLWVVTSTGHLMNYTVAGALISDTDVTPGPCGLGDNLTGLGYDTTNGTFYVTDGGVVAHITSAGVAAPSEFYFPDTCETVFPGGPPAPISGLAFSLRPARYGAGSDPVGGAPPPRMVLAWELAGVSEQTAVPFVLLLGVEDAEPFGTGALVIGLSAPCTPFKFKGCDIWVNLPWIATPPAAIGAFGTDDVALAVPFFPCGAAEIGISLYAQWVLKRPAAAGGGWETSEAVVLTFGKP